MSQLALDWIEQEERDARSEELFDALRELVALKGTKWFAGRLRVKEPTLAHALAGQDRFAVRFEWLPDILAVARELQNERLINVICSFQRGRFEALPLDPSEELRAWKEAVASTVGPEFQQAIKRKVYGRGVP